MILEQCKGVHCVDLVESFPTSIFLRNFVSIQPRTSPVKFAASQTAALPRAAGATLGKVAVSRRAVAGPRVAGTKNIGSDDICGGARRLLRIEVADVVKTFIESARSS